MRPTSLNTEVIVIVDGQPHKGTIVEAFSQGAARIELGDKSSIQASHSPKGEEGTFHYEDEQPTAADPLDHDRNGRKGGSLPKSTVKPQSAAAAPAPSA